MNTRLQVEHPITEASTGLDLVKLQILVADGHRLEGDPPPVFGHSIEARLNAEDADNGFAPSPGKVELLTLPTGPGIRVDTGIATGDVISPDYDSMVAKIIAWGRDRPEALARLRVALRDTTVVVKGGTTTKSFLLALLDHPEVINGTADTGWLDRAGLTDQPRVAAACRRGAAVRRGRRVRDRGGPGARGVPARRPAVVARAPPTRSAGRSSSATRARPTRSRSRRSARAGTASRWPARCRRGGGRAAVRSSRAG